MSSVVKATSIIREKPGKVNTFPIVITHILVLRKRGITLSVRLSSRRRHVEARCRAASRATKPQNRILRCPPSKSRGLSKGAILLVLALVGNHQLPNPIAGLLQSRTESGFFGRSETPGHTGQAEAKQVTAASERKTRFLALVKRQCNNPQAGPPNRF